MSRLRRHPKNHLVDRSGARSQKRWDSFDCKLDCRRSAIVRVIHQEPAFAQMFIAHLLGRTIRVEADLVDQLFNSSEKRLARLLLLANFGKEDKPESMIAKISQEALTEMIGSTRSRVIFFMNKFRKLGFIHYKWRHPGPQFVVECLVFFDEPNIET